MSRAFTKERDDAPEPEVRPAPHPTGQVTSAWYDAARSRLDQEPDPQERARLQDQLDTAVVVDAPADRKVAALGATVVVIQGVGAKRTSSTYTIVGDVEADVRAGKIGLTSPLAQALLGAKAGQRVVWHRPAGDVTLRVDSIAYG